MSDSSSFTFPDASRAELDKSLDELVEKARDVLATQGRLRALLRANQAVIEHIDLPTVLRRIVEAGLELVGAQFGALGVIAPDGSLEQFVHVGMPPETVKKIGHLPEGHGLLGALIDDPRAIRIPDIAADPRSVGVPAHHAQMTSFLGVPIRVRDEVYGNLYLCNRETGEFSDEDEQLITALAATAGFAIENARLFAETRRRQAWAVASAEITAALLSSDEVDVVALLASRVLSLAGGDTVWLLQPSSDPAYMIIEKARGIDHELLQGTQLPVAGSLSASVLEARQPRLIDDSAEYGLCVADGRALGPVMALPMVVAGRSTGVILVGRLSGSPRFTHADIEFAADFAGRASVAMELAAARRGRQRVALLEDRGRIARDLHDHVIQQLFATGLELQSIAGTAAPELGEQLNAAVADIDASISHIRTVVFALSSASTESAETVRHTIIDLANDAGPRLHHTPRVSFSGPVDLVVTDTLADDVIAVTRESLMNVIKHAEATSTSVELSVTDDAIRLHITDNGHGAADSTRRSGIANLEQRATNRDGTFNFESDDTGTSVTWTVPLGETP